MAKQQTAVATIMVVPQSDWDDIKHPGQRVTVKRVTATSVQVIEQPTGKVFSRNLAEFRNEYKPAPSTVRSQTPRREPPLPPAARKPTPPKPGRQETVAQRNFRMAMEEAATEDVETLQAAADIYDNGQQGKIVLDAATAPVAPQDNEPTDDRRTPTLGEAVAADWNQGNGLKWAELQSKYHVSGTRLKQLLTPYGYTSREDTVSRQRIRQAKAATLLTSPDIDRAKLSQLPEEAVHVESHVVTVTPVMSAEWLERGGVNRPVDDAHVRNLAGNMKRGEWRLTGEAIKLNRDGKVRDGQHRLWACIEAGTPFTTLVVINVPDDAFDVMDTGRVRRVSDILSIHGMDNAGRLAPAARLAIAWDKAGVPLLAGRSTITSPQVLEFLAAHPEFPTAVVVGDRIMRAGIPGGPSVWSCVVWKLSQVSAHDCESFVQALTTGVSLGPGHPILALRNRLLGSRARMLTNEVAALAIKAWNIWRRDDEIHVLSWRRGEAFPKPE